MNRTPRSYCIRSVLEAPRSSCMFGIHTVPMGSVMTKPPLWLEFSVRPMAFRFRSSWTTMTSQYARRAEWWSVDATRLRRSPRKSPLMCRGAGARGCYAGDPPQGCPPTPQRGQGSYGRPVASGSTRTPHRRRSRSCERARPCRLRGRPRIGCDAGGRQRAGTRHRERRPSKTGGKRFEGERGLLRRQSPMYAHWVGWLIAPDGT